MSRGQVSAIRDPAIGIAAAKCWLARWQKGGMTIAPVTSFHPKECGFCDYPTERLQAAVLEFNAWAGIRPARAWDEVVPVREQLERFQMLPKEEQDRLVSKAQGYLD